jgi:membrane-associated phospholipid phosphatase
MLIAIFLWPRVRRALRVLLAGYPLFMGFTLVYGGEHYVFDILTGWVAAGLVCIAAARVERRWRDAETSRDAVTVTDLGRVAVLPTAVTPMHADQLSE